ALKTRVTDQGGLSVESSVVTIQVEGIASPDFSLYLNAGSSETVTYQGKEFIGDMNTGEQFYNDSRPDNIPQASNIELFQSTRSSNIDEAITYTIPVPNGMYKVTTYFIENYFGVIGSACSTCRAFDILIEGNKVRSNFNIYASSANDPLEVVFEEINVEDGQLEISLDPKKSRSIIAGLAIESSESIIARIHSKPTILASPMEGSGPLKVDFMGDLTGVDQGNLSYSYEFEDGSSSMEKNPSHLFVSPGSHEVKVTVRDGKELVSQETITIQVNKFGLNTDSGFGKSSIRMYPNPASDLINLQSTDPEEKLGEISIFDVRGRMVQTYLPEMVENGNKYTISVRNLAAGVYFLTTTTEEGISQLQRLIVVK
ncbi:malectin domain-containing carbohydrate-binding protein, partial [Algoriphagus sp.]|uniref:malectin domain-containing carbohydrate-binding protein n=1 Tax=Algoriphagus sp. TaxID=1872435 RepID=UPI0025EEC674